MRLSHQGHIGVVPDIRRAFRRKEEDEMRKFLLASVATLGTGGLVGAAFAQAPGGAPTQGQVAYPLVNPTAYVNNNNNYQAPALPGALANPTPGTIVVHVNGKVQAEFQGIWSSLDQRVVAAPAGSLGAGTPGGPAIVGVGAATPAGTVLGNNGSGVVKLQPQNISSFARIYMGGDGMATNGLRYGAAIEVRQNFTGQISNSGSTGASGYSSLNTMYVRRAFTYAAGENWGIARLGVGDGIIGIFDNGVTTFQFLPTGNLNGGDLQNFPTNVSPTFVFLSQAGNEYDNAKFVYLSPQIAGFDFGFQYAPNTSNGFGMGGVNNALNGSIISAGTGTGLSCTAANSGCPSMSSGPGSLDGARILNQTAVGLRYQGKFGDVGLLAYAAYMFSGHANYTGPRSTTLFGATNLAILPASFGGGVTGAGLAARTAYTGNYDGLSFGSGGIAGTFGGFTVGGNVIGGRVNGQLALKPQGGVNTFGFLVGAKYVAGPLTAGIVAEEWWQQGSVQLSGISQRRGRAISTGVSYTVAPGYQIFGEYLWNDQQQSLFNFSTSVNGSGANNNVKGQGFVIGNVVNF